MPHHKKQPLKTAFSNTDRSNFDQEEREYAIKEFQKEVIKEASKSNPAEQLSFYAQELFTLFEIQALLDMYEQGKPDDPMIQLLIPLYKSLAARCEISIV